MEASTHQTMDGVIHELCCSHGSARLELFAILVVLCFTQGKCSLVHNLLGNPPKGCHNTQICTLGMPP
jgi:hypothetical protein